MLSGIVKFAYSVVGSSKETGDKQATSYFHQSDYYFTITAEIFARLLTNFYYNITKAKRAL